MLLENKNAWAYDFEVFPNLTTLVAREIGTKNYLKFVVHESQNDSEALIEWFKTRPVLIGFNSLSFDAQIVEKIFRHGQKFDAEFVYEFMQELPIITKKSQFDVPFSEWDLTHRHLDLFKINHYDNKSKATSLKWLEHTMRRKRIKDLPFDPETIISKSNVAKVLSYNKEDVDATYDFTYCCETMIGLRSDMAKKYRENRILNMSDSSMGAYIFEHILTKEYGMSKKELKKGTHYSEIHGKDILLPYIKFQNPAFQQVHQTFKDRVYRNEGSDRLTDVKGKKWTQNALFDDMVFVYGSGGLHACYKAGEYLEDDDHVILSIDVASYYPNLAIKNKLFPRHIGKAFCKIYENVYNQRKVFPKGTSMNYGLKIALNSVYGKSNSEWSIFYDLAYLLKITVNGQLLLTMLAEHLAPLGRLLLVNTDGLEIKIPKANLEMARDICAQWEMATGLELEEGMYSKLIIRDVNNYIAVDNKGKAKRKGFFMLHEDITEEGGKPHSYDKTPNATIIPMAIFNHYVHDKPLYDTIYECNDVHEFTFGIKKKKNFEYWLFDVDDEGVIDIEKRVDRVLRYFVSPKGSNIYKFWTDGRKNNLQGVNRGQLVTVAQTLINPDIERLMRDKSIKIQYDIDREYYLEKAQEMVDIITDRTRDQAYLKYMKKQEKQNA